MTPEQKARVSIDATLVAADWHFCQEAISKSRAASDAVNPPPLHAEQILVVVENGEHLFSV